MLFLFLSFIKSQVIAVTNLTANVDPACLVQLNTFTTLKECGPGFSQGITSLITTVTYPSNQTNETLNQICSSSCQDSVESFFKTPLTPCKSFFSTFGLETDDDMKSVVTFNLKGFCLKDGGKYCQITQNDLVKQVALSSTPKWQCTNCQKLLLNNTKQLAQILSPKGQKLLNSSITDRELALAKCSSSIQSKVSYLALALTCLSFLI